MSEKVKPVQDGAHTVMPHLVAKDAKKAIAFYKEALGAVETCMMLCPQTGKVMHASVRIGDSMVMLCDEFPGCGGALSPESIGGSPVVLHLSVPDIDATLAKAVEAGATLTMPAADMFWGDRYGKFTDPSGHLWAVSTHVEDVTPEQMTERMANFSMAPA